MPVITKRDPKVVLSSGTVGAMALTCVTVVIIMAVFHFWKVRRLKRSLAEANRVAHVVC